MSLDMPRARANGLPTNPLSPALKLARLGDYHSKDRCWLCGCLSSEAELHETTVRMSFALGMTCVDVVACLRRKREAA